MAAMIDEISQTALTAAAARAAHLIVDREPYVFADTLAASLLGDRAEELLAYHRLRGDHVILAGARAQVVVRARIAEDRLAAAGAGQYVILGAGLDSFAYRSPLADGMRVFEVDHPATQDAKRERAAAAALEARAMLRHVPVDFEKDDLVEALAKNGLDRTRPAFVSWLGVSVYLSRAAIGHALDEVATLGPGSEIVLDYMLPPELRDPAGQIYADGVGPVAAQRGEPWLSFFSPGEMAGLLREHGFAGVASVGQRETLTAKRTDALRPAALSMVAHARRG
jgi:methyltransferase (TIGR00027 family)